MPNIQSWDLKSLSQNWTDCASLEFERLYPQAVQDINLLISDSKPRIDSIMSAMNIYFKSNSTYSSAAGGFKSVSQRLYRPTNYVSFIDVFPIINLRGECYWISNINKRYYQFLRSLAHDWTSSFSSSHSDYVKYFGPSCKSDLLSYAILPDMAGPLTKIGHTVSCLKSFPIIPSLSDDKFKNKLGFNNQHEEMIASLFMEVFVDKSKINLDPRGFSLPKDSSTGYPLCINNGDIKRDIAWQLFNDKFDSVFSLLDQIDMTTDCKSNDEIMYKLLRDFGISRISIGGERTQVDNNSESNIKKRPFNIGSEAYTVPNIDSYDRIYSGYGAKRLRSVDGLPFTTNLYCNYILSYLREFYGHEYGAVYKTRGCDELSTMASKCIFMYGSDVTQLDNNIHPERIKFYSSYFSSFVAPSYQKAYNVLWRLLQYPCKLYKPLGGSFSLPIILNEPFKFPTDDRILRGDDHATGLPSGSAFTSEIGKCEMTAYYFIQFYYTILNIKRSAKFKSLVEEIFYDLRDKCIFNLPYNLNNANFSESLSSFNSSIDIKDEYYTSYFKFIESAGSFKHFIYDVLNNHMDGNLFFKNCGDDTVFGCTNKYLPLLIGFIILIIYGSRRKDQFKCSSNLFSYLVDNYGDKITLILSSKTCYCCDWHVIDAEEPISYLGFQCYFNPAISLSSHSECVFKYKFYPNLCSLAMNSFIPEYSQSKGTKYYTFGLGGLYKLDYYSINPYFNKALAIINKHIVKDLKSLYSLRDTYIKYESIVNGEKYLTDRAPDIKDLNDDEVVFLNNPETIYYKVDESNIRSTLLSMYVSRLSESDCDSIHRKLFHSSVHINLGYNSFNN